MLKKQVILEFINGDSKAYQDICKLVSWRMEPKIIQKYDGIESVVNKLWERLQKLNWDSYDENEAKEIFYRKLKDICFQGGENQNRRENYARVDKLSSLRIPCENLFTSYGREKFFIPIDKIRRVFYYFFKSKEDKRTKCLVGYEKGFEGDFETIYLQAREDFCKFVLEGENPVSYMFLEHENDSMGRTMKGSKSNTIKFRKIPKPYKESSIEHQYFKAVANKSDKIQLDICDVKEIKEAKKLMDIISGENHFFEVCTVTGFQVIGNNLFSIEQSAKCFADERLFTKELPGKLLLLYIVDTQAIALTPTDTDFPSDDNQTHLEELVHYQNKINELKKHVEENLCEYGLEQELKKKLLEVCNKYYGNLE